MSSVVFSVSGIDPNKSASMVFVWCKRPDELSAAFVGTGHIVRSEKALPPGISAGQFIVTFILLKDASDEDFYVTDNIDGDVRLSNIKVSRTTTARNYVNDDVIGPKGADQGLYSASKLHLN